MRQLRDRVRSLESTAGDGRPAVWHRLVWRVGEAWDDVLATYGEHRISPGDGVIIRRCIAGAGGKAVQDPVRERDEAKAAALLAARETRH